MQRCLVRINSLPTLLPRNVPSALLFVFRPSYGCPQTSSLWDYLTAIIVDKALKSRLVLRTFITHKISTPQSVLMPIKNGRCDEHRLKHEVCAAINSSSWPHVSDWRTTGKQHLSWLDLVRQMFFRDIYQSCVKCFNRTSLNQAIICTDFKREAKDILKYFSCEMERL